ncbi:hypothetical protein [Spongiactinospora sp. TRM90649]|uniref:hypothetical protein n=1 Tax=Spongiactinospora sp. TRM90649 TaxID=3031114 RepID=UPI0023F7E071|nr:hypothetical protein [Spongiactinospora sp. TRM90649]MDF5758788.1 hypothetical protein [Spongiactinospora sp. TRM90649]
MTIHADTAATVPDTAATPSPDTDTTAAPNDRQEAMWAALMANPGASATILGAEAGISRITASKILKQFEGDGRATRTPGGHDGRGRTPDCWHPADTAVSAPADDGEHTGESPEEPDEIAPAAENGVPEPEQDDHAEPQGDEPADTPEADADSESDGEPDEPDAEEDPARSQARSELLELADLIIGTVTAMETDEAIIALGRLEMFMAKAPQVHRNARALLTGTSAPGRTASRTAPATTAATGGAVRPGQLRDRVLEHLTQHAGKDFTPYEIGRVLDSSSGAVANALDRLVSLGQAELTCERPRRFSLAS